jgi:tetratricopeptide (TPR) repeat protein
MTKPSSPFSSRKPTLTARVSSSLQKAAALYAAGRYAEALEVAERNQEPNNPQWIDLSAACLDALGSKTEARRIWEDGLSRYPDYANFHLNLGRLLQEMGALGEAEKSYRRFLAVNRKSPPALGNLGRILAASRRYEEAETCFRQTLVLQRDMPEILDDLALVLRQVGRYEEAEAAARKAMAQKPDFAPFLVTYGTIQMELHRHEEAERYFRKALALYSEHPRGNFQLGCLMLYLGRWEEGWRRYEYRYHPKCFPLQPYPIPKVACPRWNGENLAGKSLLIVAEQGLGDFIQFGRYTRVLKDLGAARITLICAPPLKSLLATLEGVDTVVSDDRAVALPEHDYWTYPLSIPLHLETTPDNVPGTLPYLLAADADRVEHWREKLALPGLKVGLVWKGNPSHPNDKNRSLPGLETLARLWEVPGVFFVSLQKTPEGPDGSELPGNQPILNMGSALRDFADTAAVIEHLDLVITVDTSVAHLAGALGKPCWVLLPFIRTDWRWLHGRSDSPWYPGIMRLFRQPGPGDWASVMGEVVAELKACVTPRVS